jgi:hypothetical protein
MLEQIPNVFKRERRRDVIEKGLDSMHFRIAVSRMELLLDEMEEPLSLIPGWSGIVTRSLTLPSPRISRVWSI